MVMQSMVEVFTEPDTDSGVTYYEAQYSADESKARLAVGMGAGKAYVKECINTVATQYVTIDKARDFDSANNTTTNAPIDQLHTSNKYFWYTRY